MPCPFCGDTNVRAWARARFKLLYALVALRRYKCNRCRETFVGRFVWPRPAARTESTEPEEAPWGS